MIFATSIFANELIEAKKAREETIEKVDEIIESVDKKKQFVEQKVEQIQVLEEQISLDQMTLDTLENNYLKYRDLYDITKTQENKARENYEQEAKKAKEAILRVYKKSKESYLNNIIRSKSVFDFYSSVYYVDKMIQQDKEVIKKASDALKEASYKSNIALLEVDKVYDDYRDFKSNLNKEIASRSNAVRMISDAEKEIAKLIDQEELLTQQADEMIEEIKKLQKESNVYVGGEMAWPLPGYYRIASKFGMRLHPIYKVWKMHTGIDIGANYYDKIVAANDGVVIFSGYKSGYGYTVIVDHGGGITTLYAHCSKLLVSYDDLVFKGDVIAKIGSTGTSTGPHLHFEVRENGNWVNPVNYVSP